MYKPSAAYIPALDGFRGVSILLVYFAHIGLERYVPGGLGVTIFFFISGYIITRLLIAEYRDKNTLDLGSFYIRRLLRLYPPLLFSLALFFIYIVCLHTPVDTGEAAASVFYYENYYFFCNPDSTSAICKILWSLAVEEHFYLVFPVLFLLLIRKPKLFLYILVLLIFVPLVFRFAGVIAYQYSKDVTERYCYLLTHTRFDSIMYGCLSAVLFYGEKPEWYQRVLSNKLIFISALAVMAGCLIYRDTTFRNTIRYSLQGISLSILIPAIINIDAYQQIRQFFCGKVIVLIGRMSYSIYLTHMMAITSLMFLKNNGHWLLYYVLTTLLTTALSAFSYFFIEKTFGKIKSRFKPKSDLISEHIMR